MKATKLLHDLGQSLWLDNITRDLIDSGTLKRYIDEFSVVGKKTFEDDLGIRGFKRLGRKKWQKRVAAVTKRFVSALLLDEVVLGGGNAKKLTRLPLGCRLGENANAFPGGFRLWEREAEKS